MALDAKHRSSIYNKLLPTLGEDDANALMTEFPSVEAGELVTKDHLRAELALTRSGSREDMAGLRTEVREEMTEFRVDLSTGLADLRAEMAEGFRRQQVFMLGAIAAATAVLGTLTSVF